MKIFINLSLLLPMVVLTLVGVSSAQTEQKAELVVQTGHAESISLITFSPDGKLFASANSSEIKLWEIASRRELRTITLNNKDGLISIKFSYDGRILAGSFNRKTTSLWEVTTGDLLKTINENQLAFSSDNKYLVCGSNEISLRDIETGQLMKKYEISVTHPVGQLVRAVTISPDNETIAAFISDNTIKIWNIETGKLLQSIAITSKLFANTSNDNFKTNNFITYSPDGKLITITNKLDGSIFVDLKAGKKVNPLEKSLGFIVDIAFSSDKRTVITESVEGIISWNLRDGKYIKTLTPQFNQFDVLSVSPDGKTLASLDENKIRLWDILNGKELEPLVSHSSFISNVAVDSNSQIMALGRKDGTIKLWNLKTGQILRTLKGHNSEVGFVRFSDDGQLLASHSFEIGNKETVGTIKLWNAITGKELRTLTFEEWVVGFFSPDGKIFLVVSNNPNNPQIWSVSLPYGESVKLEKSPDWFNIDRKIFQQLLEKQSKTSVNGLLLQAKPVGGISKLINLETKKEIVSLFILDENDWAIVTPDGLFDSSPNARKLMHYVIGLETISLEQMKDVYYVPGLLQKIFKGEPLPKVELFSKQDLFPQVEYTPLKPNQKELIVKLTNRGGGIGQVQVLFNGKELINDARPVSFNPNSLNTTLTVDLSKASVKAGEENKIEIIARNASGSLSTRGTRGSEVLYVDTGKKQTETPNIYAIIGGVSNYTGDNLKLGFAAKDAEDFAKAIELGATKLIGDKSKIHIRLLTSNGANTNVKFDLPDARISTATKENFIRAFDDFKTATPNDLFIVYLSGHGVSLNLNQNPNQAGGDTYLYLTQEATTTDKSVLSIENSRKAMAISSEELKDLMKQNKALKQVLILDTCAAGALSNSLVLKRDLPSDQIRAIERLKDNTGFFVLMGSSADAVSYEASVYGQGLLTYSLLQGMKGARLRENYFADVGLLFGYAQEQVPIMARNIGGIQRPLIIMPDTSASFDIGKFTEDVQKQIQLSNPKPIILLPNLQNRDQDYDDLELTPLLRQSLREANYVSARGRDDSKLVFVEAEEMVDAIKPSGSYTVVGKTIKINLRLIRNKTPVATLTIEGSVDNKGALIKQIIAAITQAASSTN